MEWSLLNYKPAAPAVSLEAATEAFLAEKVQHVREPCLKHYRRTLAPFRAAFPGRNMHSFTTDEVQSFLTERHTGKKRCNNLRGDLQAFFPFCTIRPREWMRDNPVSARARRYSYLRSTRRLKNLSNALRLQTLLVAGFPTEPSGNMVPVPPHMPLLKVMWSTTPLARTSRRALPYSSSNRSA